MSRRLNANRILAIWASSGLILISLLVGIAIACEGGGGTNCFGTEVPSVLTEKATEVKYGDALLKGSVNPKDCETTYKFEYGTSTSYSFSTVESPAGAGTTSSPESAHITGLAPQTTYHFRIVAKSLNGEATPGADETFTTPPEPPSVTTEEATKVEDTVATLNGSVNAKNTATEYWFEYGTKSKEYTQVTTAGKVAGTETVKVNATIKSLSPEATYYFRLVAKSAGGFTPGGEKSFTTTGSTWKTDSTPNPTGATSSRLAFASCTASAACTSVGEYVNGSGVKVPLAERWNGTAWSAQTPPNPSGASWSELLGVSCTSSTSCAAAGLSEVSSAHQSLVESWNGTEWTIQTVPNPSGATSSELSAISCTSSTACTAVGHYKTSTSSPTLAERWNGTSWAVQSTLNPTGATESSLLGVSCTSGTACTAVGYYYNSANERFPLAEAWNGTSWSIQTTPTRLNATRHILLGVSCTSSTACTAVGGDFPSTGSQETLVERWNGTEWTIQTSANPSGSEASVLHGVYCISATECMAVGDWIKAGVNVTLGERWNGSSWALQTTPNPAEATSFSALWSVACTATDVCVAPGYYKNSAGTELAFAEKST